MYMVFIYNKTAYICDNAMFNFDIFSTGSSHIASSQADQVKKTRVVGSRGQAALPARAGLVRFVPSPTCTGGREILDEDQGMFSASLDVVVVVHSNGTPYGFLLKVQELCIVSSPVCKCLKFAYL